MTSIPTSLYAEEEDNDELESGVCLEASSQGIYYVHSVQREREERMQKAIIPRRVIFHPPYYTHIPSRSSLSYVEEGTTLYIFNPYSVLRTPFGRVCVAIYYSIIH